MRRAEANHSAGRSVAAPSSPIHPLSSSSVSTSPVASPRARRPMSTTTDELLYAQPTSVHFGGFELERSVQQRVRVHNNSAKAVRLRYTFPTGKKGFRATFSGADRPPFVSAGLSEEIIVSFTPPAGFQYYYDCIQVRCEEVAYGSSTDVARSGATLIPLHAYPMLNEVTFPTRMDFGVVPRGTCARKYVDIACSVPVEFEYELRVTKPHPAFTVFPLTGTIPPRGEARIELEFRPMIYATASAELELHVSQLGFAPRVCTLAGSSSSTATNTGSIIAVSEHKAGSPAPSSSESKPRRGSEAQQKASKTNTPRNGAKSRDKKCKDEPQFDDADEEEELEKVQGVEIPNSLNSVTGVTFVLNQEPGKLKPKDLKKAIAANRALRQQQQEEQAKLNGLGLENEDAVTLSFQTLIREEERFLDRVRVSKQVKDMFFQQEMREVAGTEKALEFQSHKVHLGQRLFSREQIAQLAQLRELNFQTLTRQQRERLRTLFCSVRYEPPVVSDNQIHQSDGTEAFLPDELKTAVLPAHFMPAYTPDFKSYKNDLWARRQRLLRRLVRAVSTCIIRFRAQKRLDRIRAWLGGAKTRAHVREKVALDWESYAQSGGGGIGKEVQLGGSLGIELQNPVQGGLDSLSNAETHRYFLSSFPLVEESTTQKRRESIALPADWELKFNSFTFMELKPRDEALLMGHELLSLPALPTHVSLEQCRTLRHGAAGECDVATSLLPAPDSVSNLDSGEGYNSEQALAAMPPSLLEVLPHDRFLLPQASVRPLMELQGPRETESSYALLPQRVFRTPPSIFSAWQSSQLGLQSIVEYHELAGLCVSDVFVGSADRRNQVDPLFPQPNEVTNADDDLSIFGDVWSIRSTTMPSLTIGAGDVPSLSDSESDDDVESRSGPTGGLTWKHALELFETSMGEQEGKMEGGSDITSIHEEGELLGREKGVYSFERYRHLLRQERTYNSHRQDHLERLSKLLDAALAQIDHPDYALVLHGHGSERPLHHVQQPKALVE
ncbi:hypothetical protein PF005_g24240 [Phytophthora fragariae]|uniref:MSP domain-containing protein n=1 Tax=Phytophthora fragariae TaxID=53985 RepID=A0A6A3QJK2_9STRA|nr:hypothetical protein PF003_g36321 [Phytophthora fragariae]KAE8924751.1 hypothetical protein PF009_g25023 [Phytophthora fragariae]KAE8980902.1 hypothetical protein PF011_g22241 [Phytophthora fragariae]KAE9076810.1 hypothetical protein PF010_g23753 [Phytophthora fragariae]KAE9077568.1 hypothetical protein PF007_g24191 [Phytophthora fragariae]